MDPKELINGDLESHGNGNGIAVGSVAGAAPLSPSGSLEAAVEPPNEERGAAATGTINARLLAELEEARSSTTSSPSASSSSSSSSSPWSSWSQKLGLDSMRPQKTEEERQRALEEARDLNGVNPLVALGSSSFTLAVAAGLWRLTSLLGEYYALHPIENDNVYIVARVTAVARNVGIGLVTLASGFFGVTGVGIGLLGLRVAYGVLQGELDPTPVVRKKPTGPSSSSNDFELPSAWDLMMNKKKKPSRPK